MGSSRIPYADENWTIRENDEFITGDTYMDNFYFSKFFELIDVDNNIITWGEFPFDLTETYVEKE